MSAEPNELDQAVEGLCRALRAHAEVLQTFASDPVVVIRSGELVSRAVLEHETAVMRVGGWSSPIRHLGKLPIYDQSIGPASNASDDREAVKVTARYELQVREPADVVDAVRGRFADDTIDSLATALRRLVEAEGWDPTQVAGGAIRVTGADVDVEV
jgi:hypothetical protein